MGYGKRYEQDKWRGWCNSLDYGRGREMGRMQRTPAGLVEGLNRKW